jgi:hypothetical protein
MNGSNPAVAAAAAFLSASTCALARPEVGPGDFSGSEQRVNFDNLSGGSSLYTGDPISNQYAGQGIIFSNNGRPMQANNYPASLFTNHSPPNAAFIDQGGGSTPGVLPMRITLSVPVNRIGMFVCGSANVTYTLSVYGASGLLETLTKPGIPGGAGTTTYVGLQRPEQITYADVYCTGGTPYPYNFFIDDVQFEAVGGTTCYPNCDNSTAPPILNANDFQCFLNRFAAGDSYANCDQSSSPPILNANDFQCFLNAFAAGCS